MEVKTELKLKVNKTADMKAYQKEYQEKNKDRILFKIKQNYMENRDRKLEYMRTPNVCKCGGRFSTVNRQQHLKSKKHQNHEFSKLFIKNKETFISKKGDVYEYLSDYQSSQEK
jgi:hypothetical protein